MRAQGRKTLGREWGCDCKHKRKIGYMDNVPLPIPDRHINRSEYRNWSAIGHYGRGFLARYFDVM